MTKEDLHNVVNALHYLVSSLRRQEKASADEGKPFDTNVRLTAASSKRSCASALKSMKLLSDYGSISDFAEAVNGSPELWVIAQAISVLSEKICFEGIENQHEHEKETE